MHVKAFILYSRSHAAPVAAHTAPDAEYIAYLWSLFLFHHVVFMVFAYVCSATVMYNQGHIDDDFILFADDGELWCCGCGYCFTGVSWVVLIIWKMICFYTSLSSSIMPNTDPRFTNCQNIRSETYALIWFLVWSISEGGSWQCLLITYCFFTSTIWTSNYD